MILVLALDALDPDLVARFRSQGRLPTLGKLAETGRFGRLRSSFPPVSVPAWSTFLTGVGPGQHGLFDFTRLEGGRIRFQNAADRGVPSLIELADEAGKRVCSIGLPTTYPVPELARGAVLAGFDSPFTGAPDPRAQSPIAFWRRARRAGVDLGVATIPEGRKRAGWHRRAARGLGRSIERRVAQTLYALGEGPWDLLLVHFQAADTAGHHFFRYFDSASPRHDAAHPDRARVLPDIYDALDRAVTRLIRACPTGTDVVVLSDHGMGPASDSVCHLNRWLEEEGFLLRRPRRDLAGALRGFAIRRLPPGLQARLFRWLRDGPASRLESRARLGGLDLSRSAAFSEESSTLPGVWVLDPRRKEEILRRLRSWDAVTRVYRREDIYRGPLRRHAPDLLLELRHTLVRTPPGYGGPAVRRLEGPDLEGERGAGMNGVHRPEGILCLNGPAFGGPDELSGAWIGDLAPTLLTALRVPVPSWMEGRPLVGSSGETEVGGLDTRPEQRTAELSSREERRLERRLRALGYLG
jgi:predicted AlkP superfamily phosphohydrolase/phosphomutase